MNAKLLLSLCSLLLLAAEALGQPNPVGVFAEVSQPSVTEGGSFIITVRANATQTFDYLVHVAFDLYDAPGHPGANDLGGAIVGTVTIRANQLSATPLNVTALTDGMYEGNETFEFRINADTLVFPAYRPISPTNVFVTIFDADLAPQVYFSTTTGTVTEENVTVPISVLLSPRSQAEVRVNWAVALPPLTSATYGTDFNMLLAAQSGTLVFPGGRGTNALDLRVMEDTTDEPDERVVLNLSNPIGATLRAGFSTNAITIIDDDAPPAVSFEAAAGGALENAGTRTIHVRLSAASGQTVTVGWSITGGTATAGSDFTGTTAGTLTFNPGQTLATLSLPVVNDATEESDETVLFSLSAPGNATLAAPTTYTHTIQNDDVSVFWAKTSVTNSEADGFATFEVRLSRTLSIALQVQLTTISHTATAGEDFTAPPSSVTIPVGQTSVFIAVPLLNDSLNETLEIAELRLSNPTVGQITGQTSAELRITDDEGLPTISFVPFSVFNPGFVQVGENVGQIFRAVTLSRPSGRPVWCTVSVQGSSATIFDDFVFDALPNQFLVINEGETNAEFSLTITDDTLFEGNEDIVLTLVSLNGASPGARTSGTIRIQDNDTAPTASFGNFSTSFQEAITSPSMPVQLSAPAAIPVKVNVAVTGGTATGGGVDFTLNSGTVYFEAGETNKHVNLTCVNDSLDEFTETINLTLSPGSPFSFPPDGYTAIGVAGILNRTFDIVDDDAPPVASIPSFFFALSEGQSTSAVVRLSAPSSLTVTMFVTGVHYNTTNEDFSISPGWIEFAPGETQKAVTISTTADALVEGDEAFSLTLHSPIGATLGGAASRPFFILDDDGTPVAPEDAMALGLNLGHRVRFRKAGGPTDIYSINSAEVLLDLALPNAQVAFEVNDDGVVAINYVDASTDPVPQGYFGSDRDFHSVPGTPTFAAGNIDDFAMSASGYLYVPDPGNWIFTVRSDDGFRLRIGSNDTVVAEYVDGRAPGDSIAVVNIPRSGYYRYELTYFENFGGAQIEFLVRPPYLDGNDELVGSANGRIQVFRDLDVPPSVRPVREPFIPGAAGHQVEFRKSSFNLTDVPVAQSLLSLPFNDARVLAVASDHGVSVINYDDDSGSPGFFAGDRQIATPPMSASKGSFNSWEDNNFAMRATGFIQVTNPGVWSFVVHSDDGFQLRLGTNQQVVSAHLAPRAPAATTNRVNFPVTGYYPFELIFFEWGGGALVEFFAFGPGQSTPTLVGDARGVLRVYQTGTSEARLTITKSGNQATLRWPSAATGFTLERCSDFAGASTVWTPVSGSPVMMGQFWQQTDNLSGTARCYRLRKP